MRNRTMVTDPFKGIGFIMTRLPKGKTNKDRNGPRWQAKLNLDASKWMFKPGMEPCAGLVGQGRRREDALYDLQRQFLALAEKVGLIGFTRPVVTFSTGADMSAATTGIYTFEV